MRWRWHSEEYLAYLRSPAWQLVRQAALERAGNRCEYLTFPFYRRCRARTHLEVHHVNYGSLGRERPQDVRVFCHKHHKRADTKRRKLAKKRAQNA